jgi:NitT/TauT family transport system substrate-binding protein
MRLRIAILIGCLAFLPAAIRADPAPQKITVAEFGDLLLYLPLYIAQQQGFLAATGLDVSAVATGNDDKTFAALVSGSAQFGISDPTFAAIAKARGSGGKVVAAVVTGVPFWGVAKNPAIHGIAVAQDLKGYTVATYPSPSTAYTLQSAMFRQGGLEPNIRQAAYGTLLPLLDSEQADIALELEPNVSTAVKNGDHIVYSMARRMPDFLLTGVEVTDDFVRSHPETIQKFVTALDRAEKFAHAHPDQAIALAAQHFPDLDKAVVHDAVMRMLDEGTLPASALMPEKSWDNALQLRVDAKDLPSLAAAAGVLDNDFAERAQHP